MYSIYLKSKDKVGSNEMDHCPDWALFECGYDTHEADRVLAKLRHRYPRFEFKSERE